MLLDHRAAASAIEEARQLARVRVQIRFIRDWVVDYSEPGAVWIISDWAWYRCAAMQPVRSLHCNACGQDAIWQMSQNISQRADSWRLQVLKLPVSNMASFALHTLGSCCSRHAELHGGLHRHAHDRGTCTQIGKEEGSADQYG